MENAILELMFDGQVRSNVEIRETLDANPYTVNAALRELVRSERLALCDNRNRYKVKVSRHRWAMMKRPWDKSLVLEEV